MKSAIKQIQPARKLFEKGLHLEALGLLDDLNLSLEEKSQVQVVMLRLDILTALSWNRQALALGILACNKFPEVDDFLLKTSYIMFDLADFDEARDLLLTGHASLKHRGAYWIALARCYKELGDIDTANAFLWEGVKLDKSLIGKWAINRFLPFVYLILDKINTLKKSVLLLLFSLVSLIFVMILTLVLIYYVITMWIADQDNMDHFSPRPPALNSER